MRQGCLSSALRRRRLPAARITPSSRPPSRPAPADSQTALSTSPLRHEAVITKSARHYSTPTMPSASASATVPTFKVVNYELLDELRRFWFEHFQDESRVVLPDMSVMKRFFMGGEEFDGACTKKFVPALEEIKALNITSSEALLNALPPRGPLDWLALLLLLDQVPRNCYRGAASGQVFTVFDPLALGIALKAIEEGIFTGHPVLRWNFAYRFWLFLPLVHSESLEVHGRLRDDIFAPSRADTAALLAGSGDRDDGSEERRRAAAVFRERRDEGRFLDSSQAEQEERHVSILRRFGRYPHRNGPLGRETTPEEQAFLDEGGATFAPPASDEERARHGTPR